MTKLSRYPFYIVGGIAKAVDNAAAKIGGCKAMREKYIEQRLVAAVKKRGGICPKWVAPGFDGVPDRLVFLPHHKFGMVEVKAPGKKPRPLQESRHKLFAALGFKVYVLDRTEQIENILDEIGGKKDAVHST